MANALHRLIYASRWAPTIWSEIDETVRRIVRVSIPGNRLGDLTGLLLVHEGWFVQALEGPKPRICGAMDRISRDDRHHEIHTLSCGAADYRAFSDWNMTEVRAGPAVTPFLTEIGMLARFDARRLDGASAFRLLLALAEAERTRERAALGLAAAE